LEASGWEVRQAEHGREALEHLQHQQPSMILLDLMMPVMDGFEFLVERQKYPKLVSIPVIVVTAKELNAAEVQQLRGTVSRVMQKGAYSQEDLRHAIRGLLERQHRPKSSTTPNDETG
jgi:CheY-like chemotaxis protein